MADSGADSAPATGTGPGKTVPQRRRRRRGRGKKQQANERRSGETGGGLAGRLWGLIALSLFMALPLMLISAVAIERAGQRAAVERMIGATWGGAQTLTGPFLVIPVEATRTTQIRLADGTLETRDEKVRVAPLVLLPETLKIDSFLNSEMRGSGNFEVPVYRSRHDIRLDIDPERIAGAGVAGLLAEGEVALWRETALGLGLSEPRALRGTLVLDSGGGPAGFQSGNFESGSGVEGLTGVHARIGDPRDHAGGWRFTLELDGSQRLRLTPAGRETEVRLRSDWPDPRFDGAFLPTWRQAGADGFAAEWSILQLAPSLPQASRGGGSLHELEGASFGAALAQPVDLYITAQRAAKYGLLFIVLSFGAIFLIGRSAARQPHLAQYALVGAAQCVFFLLLLSLAEQIGFASAYALAAGATMALLTAYAWSALGLGPRSLRLAVALGLFYGAMYLILSTEEQALLTGAVLAFLIVAATMWGTRHEDWGAAFAALKRKKPQGPAPKG
jgi:inner membrane protein